MRRNWLRMVPILLILVLVASTILGCGGKEPKGSQADGEELNGTLQINGSTTVAPIVQGWAEQFYQNHPNASVVVSGTGSGNGIAALINGTTDIAMASRKIKDKEKDAVKNGTPVEYVIGYDALAVVVHLDNGVKSLSLDQLKDIYTGKITNWQDVGGPDAQIIVYTRDTSSGTYEFFKEHVLNNEEFAETARKTSSNAAMVNSVAQEENAIGYCGIAFLNNSVKSLGISDGSAPVTPGMETAKTKKYPIVRDLSIYTINEAKGLAKAFIDFGLSEEGQALVEQVGYVPVN